MPLCCHSGPGGRPARCGQADGRLCQTALFWAKRRATCPPKRCWRPSGPRYAGATRASCGLPSISILTPLYNTPPAYLRAFLDSFAGQTAPNGQLCLADASDENHPEVGQIVREYQAKYQQIVYKKIENRGIAANTNAAAELADGEYLALADHDDVLAPPRHGGDGAGHFGPAGGGQPRRLPVQRRGPV